MNKKTLALAISLCIVLASLAGISGTKAATTAQLSLQTTPTIGPGSVNDVGTTFNVSLQIDDVTNLWSWKAAISWDPTVLNLISGPTEGSFMGSGTLFLAASPHPGSLPEVSDTYLSSMGISGGGVLANMTFKIIGYSAAVSVIGLSNAVMLDPSNPHQHIAFTTQNATFTPPPPAHVIGDTAGITGLKLVFMETMNNSFSSPATINYSWSFSVDKWSGTQWIATAISGSSTLFTDYVLTPYTAANSSYYVYPISSSAVTWGDWLEINFTFNWVSSSTDGTHYSRGYSTELNVHPGDISGAAVTFPYLGADSVVNLKDLGLITGNWEKKWTNTPPP